MSALRKLFGFEPTSGLPTWAYNSMVGLAGCALYADTVREFMGLALMLEALIVSIERCWPRAERPQ